MRNWIVSGAACCALAAQQPAGPVTVDLHADETAGPVTVDLHADVLTRLSALTPCCLACWCGLWAAMRVCVVNSRVIRGVGVCGRHIACASRVVLVVPGVGANR